MSIIGAILGRLLGIIGALTPQRHNGQATVPESLEVAFANIQTAILSSGLSVPLPFLNFSRTTRFLVAFRGVARLQPEVIITLNPQARVYIATMTSQSPVASLPPTAIKNL